MKFRRVIFFGLFAAASAKAGILTELDFDYVIERPFRLTVSTEVEHYKLDSRYWVNNWAIIPGYYFGPHKRFFASAALQVGVPLRELGFYIYDPQLRFEAMRLFNFFDAGIWTSLGASDVSARDSMFASFRLWAKTGDEMPGLPELRWSVELENRWWGYHYSTGNPQIRAPYRSGIHEVTRSLREPLLNDLVAGGLKSGLLYSFKEFEYIYNLFVFVDASYRFTRTYSESNLSLSALNYHLFTLDYGIAYQILDSLTLDFTVESVGRVGTPDPDRKFKFFGDNTSFYLGLNVEI